MPSGERSYIQLTEDSLNILESLDQEYDIDEGWAELDDHIDVEWFEAFPIDIVHFEYSTIATFFALETFHRGKLVREVLYTRDHGWELREAGRGPRPYEARSRVARFKELRWFLGSDGFEFARAALGKSETEDCRRALETAEEEQELYEEEGEDLDEDDWPDEDDEDNDDDVEHDDEEDEESSELMGEGTRFKPVLGRVYFLDERNDVVSFRMPKGVVDGWVTTLGEATLLFRDDHEEKAPLSGFKLRFEATGVCAREEGYEFALSIPWSGRHLEEGFYVYRRRKGAEGHHGLYWC